MQITVGGVTYPMAALRLADVRDLGKSGVTKAMARFVELDSWEQLDALVEILATSIRRAGGQVTARELLEAATAADQVVILEAVSGMLRESGFLPATEGGSPNAVSPGALT